MERRLQLVRKQLAYIEYLENQLDRSDHNFFYYGFLSEVIRGAIEELDDIILRDR